MSRSRTAFALGLVVPLLVVGGCSGDEPQPRIAPSESPSPTTSPSRAGPVEPTMPASATELNSRGARTFVRYWFELFSYSLASGDTSGFAGVSDMSCLSCDALKRKIDDLYGKGGWLETDGWFVEALAESPHYRDTSPVFLLRVRQDKRTLLDAHGLVVERTPMAKLPMRMTLARRAGHWSVEALEILR